MKFTFSMNGHVCPRWVLPRPGHHGATSRQHLCLPIFIKNKAMNIFILPASIFITEHFKASSRPIRASACCQIPSPCHKHLRNADFNKNAAHIQNQSHYWLYSKIQWSTEQLRIIRVDRSKVSNKHEFRSRQIHNSCPVAYYAVHLLLDPSSKTLSSPR